MQIALEINARGPGNYVLSNYLKSSNPLEYSIASRLEPGQVLRDRAPYVLCTCGSHEAKGPGPNFRADA